MALQLGLMLRFIEHFFVQWKKLDDAWRLRTGRPGGWRLIAPSPSRCCRPPAAWPMRCLRDWGTGSRRPHD